MKSWEAAAKDHKVLRSALDDRSGYKRKPPTVFASVRTPTYALPFY
ncbi:hypothetical protein [Siphonobacter sp. SORGH_AS_1065]|nr:hypothetical protein [Siphonobacter sp. SORGH_AS_1065]MDQ1090375.1 hypothetical protein [Siphonobacter sp. SORGH_AS_1065]